MFKILSSWQELDFVDKVTAIYAIYVTGAAAIATILFISFNLKLKFERVKLAAQV
jgi:hypothetical protein